MKITDVELHEIYPPLQAFNGAVLKLYQGDSYDTRTIIVLHTDNGLEGLGEVVGPCDDQLRLELEQLRGENPCRWLAHPTLRVGIAPAIYDLVGKANDVPAYHLFGPKVRSWVPLGYWTVSQTPAKMAGEVKRARELGFTWLKYHTDPFHNAVDQTRAMQEVAPPGFKIHYDVNFNNTVEHIVTLSQKLAEFPIAGLIEDPLNTFDMEGHKQLRSRCPLPIVFHHLPLGGREAMMGVADGYMLGHAPIGQVVSRAGLFESANTPFMIQNVGGNITRAMVVHMAAAFEQATLHHITDTFAWEEDVVHHPFEVIGGTVSVPEEPGLGVQLDRDILAKLKAADPMPMPMPMPRALLRIISDGLTIYSRPPRARRDHLTLDPRFVPGYGEGYDHQTDFDYWYDDGSKTFTALWEQARNEIVIQSS
jgi:L-alanine-DL-glutamate epimerase-like enolase superfamily enzyme